VTNRQESPRGKGKLRLQYLALPIAVLPPAIVAWLLLRIWLEGPTPELNESTAIWPVVGLQLGALVFYVIQVLHNPRLERQARAQWIRELIILQSVSMLHYWYRHIWTQERR
jgi:hypothetical protein